MNRIAVVTEEDFKNHVNGFALLPNDTESSNAVNSNASFEFDRTAHGEYALSLPGRIPDSIQYLLSYKCKLGGHQCFFHNKHKVVFIKQYDHITDTLVYLGSIEIPESDETLKVIDLIKKICSLESSLPTQDATKMKLYKVYLNRSIAIHELDNDALVAKCIENGIVLCIADHSVSNSTLMAFPATGMVKSKPSKLKMRTGMGEIYRKMLNNKECSDIALKVEDQVIYVSSHVLVAQCQYFRTALRGEFAETLTMKKIAENSNGLLNGKWPILVLDDLTYDGVMACLEWMYTGHVSSLHKDPDSLDLMCLFQNIYIASDYFGLEELGELLIPLSIPLLRESNFGDAFEFSTRYGLMMLGQAAIQKMKSCVFERKVIYHTGSETGTADSVVKTSGDEKDDAIRNQLTKVFEVVRHSERNFGLFFTAMM